MSVSGKRYTLRLCSLLTTPSGFGAREIVELACLDVKLQGNEIDVGVSRIWRFRPKILSLPPPDMIAGLTLSDLPPNGCSCNPDKIRAIFSEGGTPDVFVAHGASPLRVLLPDSLTSIRPWICTHKNALQLLPGASGYTLEELTSWIEARRGSNKGSLGIETGRAGPRVLLLSRLFRELITTATLNQLLLFSSVICKPLSPPPLPSDKVGWTLLPDDDLHWFAQQNISLPLAIRSCARHEKARRIATGRTENLRFNPSSL